MTAAAPSDYEGAATQSISVEATCIGGRHRWRTYVGDPIPARVWDGQACYCGALVLHLHNCPQCGHEHLSEVPRSDGARATEPRSGGDAP